MLKDLHWLTLRKRIEFKVLLLTYKYLNNPALPYLTEHLEVYEPSLTLRSGDQLKLRVPQIIWGRVFSYAAPVLWNDLSPAIKTVSSADLFISNLKHHMLNSCHGDYCNVHVGGLYQCYWTFLDTLAQCINCTYYLLLYLTRWVFLWWWSQQQSLYWYNAYQHWQNPSQYTFTVDKSCTKGWQLYSCLVDTEILSYRRCLPIFGMTNGITLWIFRILKMFWCVDSRAIHELSLYLNVRYTGICQFSSTRTNGIFP